MARAPIAAAVLALSLAPAAALAQTAAPHVAVIPAPLTVARTADPSPVAIAEGATIFAPAGDASAVATARYLADLSRKTRGLGLKVSTARPSAGGIVLSRRKGLGAEAYALDVERGEARIEASTDAGLFYGAVTLWELITADGGKGPATLAPVRIDDHPQFAWRGLMIDSARHFQPPAEIERMIDAMALHKLSVLHWHLTDDQGWRLEIRKYPKLTEVGAWRTPAAGSPDSTSAELKDGRYGGFYTQAQVREIVGYAAARHITIVPEIEMPGHAVSALLAYPQFGAGDAPNPAAQAQWGGFPYVYNVDDATVGFLQDVLTEVMALFPGRYIHIGGDEVAKERWNSTPAAQARIAALHGADASVVQPDFTRKIAAFLEAHGRRMVGWDEILAGDLPPDSVVMSWHGIDGAQAAIAKGHDAILAPAPILYFDNQQAQDPDQPPGRGYTVRLADVYGFKPLSKPLTPEARGHLLGVQGALWTEHIRTSSQLEAMAFPRVAALAELGWSAERDWGDFSRRLPAQFMRYSALGIGADPVALSVRVEAEPALVAGQATVTLSTQLGAGEIRYTTDGSAPGPASARYDKAFPAALPAHVRAAVVLDGALAGPVTDRRLDSAAIRRRTSQELRLCNPGLALNLEGAKVTPGSDPVFLTNPQDRCWIYPAADLTGVDQVTVALARLPFNFGLDAAHNTTVVRPPRTAAGELEVRPDTCAADPIAVAALPPGPVGGRASLTLALPPRTGRHDLCITYTSASFDPMVSIDWVQLAPPGAAVPTGKP